MPTAWRRKQAAGRTVARVNSGHMATSQRSGRRPCMEKRPIQKAGL